MHCDAPHQGVYQPFSHCCVMQCMLPAPSSTLCLPSLGHMLLPAPDSSLQSLSSQHQPWQMRALGFSRP